MCKRHIKTRGVVLVVVMQIVENSSGFALFDVLCHPIPWPQSQLLLALLLGSC